MDLTGLNLKEGSNTFTGHAVVTKFFHHSDEPVGSIVEIIGLSVHNGFVEDVRTFSRDRAHGHNDGAFLPEHYGHCWNYPADHLELIEIGDFSEQSNPSCHKRTVYI